MSSQSEYILPFKKLEAYGGFAECSGMLIFDGQYLSIEFQTKDSIVGLFKTGVKTFRLAPSNIFKIEYQKGFFSSKLIIMPSSIKLLEEFPAAEDGKIILRISRENASLAAEMYSRIQLSVAEYKLQRAEQG